MTFTKTETRKSANLSLRSAALRIGLLSVVIGAASASVPAQCGPSLNAMATAANSVRGQLQAGQSLIQKDPVVGRDNAVNTSIVGLWHIRFVVGDHQIQEAYQIWNTGGTEVHNPNVDPRQGNVCLGTWKEAAPQTFQLTHRVWLYDTNGNFQGIGHLTETLTLGNRGSTHSGSFTLDLYDGLDNFVVNLATGTVVGERISPD